jgi:hypothetical protein
VVLAPDLAAVFTDANSINEALLALVNIARKTTAQSTVKNH